MNFLSKTLSLVAISAGLLTMSPNIVYGQDCDPCDSDDSCSRSFCDLDFEVGVEFLWWKPCVDDLDYAAERTTSNSPFTFQIKSIDPDWEPGVRVMLALPGFYCDWDLRVSYTYIKSDDSSKIEEDDAIVPVIGHPGVSQHSLADEGKGTWKACYHEWDVLLAYDILFNECYSVTTLFGVAGVALDQELEATLSGESGDAFTKWKSDYCGVGFRFGTDYKYRMSECFEFFVMGTATILAGDADSKNEQDDSSSNSIAVVKDDDPCQIVCGYHIGAGFIYETSVCNYDSYIKLGYEFLQWNNLPNHRTFVADGQSENADVVISTSSNTRTFGFHGLTLGLSLTF